MRDRLKDLVQLASIELAYARAEIALMGHPGEEKSRIANHLGSADENLNALIQLIGESKIPGRQKRARKQVA